MLATARASIEHGLVHHRPAPVSMKGLSPALTAPRATFVTLKMQGDLRGCIGTLRAVKPLLEDVAERAYEAAFRDPRFDPVTREELPDIRLSISVLTPPEALTFKDEKELLKLLVPGQDGLIIEAGNRKATYLPSVWEQLREPAAFLSNLKHKAGLDPRLPATGLNAWRYHVTEIRETEAG